MHTHMRVFCFCNLVKYEVVGFLPVLRHLVSFQFLEGNFHMFHACIAFSIFLTFYVETTNILVDKFGLLRFSFSLLICIYPCLTCSYISFYIVSQAARDKIQKIE